MTRSATRWSGEAPAKVNLRLDVLEREPSGFHRIETELQAIELADRILVEVRGGVGGRDAVAKVAREGVSLEVHGVSAGALGPDDENLAVRAARLVLEAIGVEPLPAVVGEASAGIRIRLEKRIPHGGGLGGGSSDAGAVLRAVNELAGSPLDRTDLMETGARLGSDVPFFVSGASRALGTGRGDRIQVLPPLESRPVLLVVPSEGTPTAWAYRELASARARGEHRAGDRGSDEIGSVSEATWPSVIARARNDFEPVLFSYRPDLAHWKEALQEAGAQPALLSGSGSTLFGVFDDLERLKAAERVVRGLGEVRTIRTWTRS